MMGSIKLKFWPNDTVFVVDQERDELKEGVVGSIDAHIHQDGVNVEYEVFFGEEEEPYTFVESELFDEAEGYRFLAKKMREKAREVLEARKAERKRKAKDE